MSTFGRVIGAWISALPRSDRRRPDQSMQERSGAHRYTAHFPSRQRRDDTGKYVGCSASRSMNSAPVRRDIALSRFRPDTPHGGESSVPTRFTWGSARRVGSRRRARTLWWELAAAGSVQGQRPYRRDAARPRPVHLRSDREINAQMPLSIGAAQAPPTPPFAVGSPGQCLSGLVECDRRPPHQRAETAATRPRGIPWRTLRSAAPGVACSRRRDIDRVSGGINAVRTKILYR